MSAVTPLTDPRMRKAGACACGGGCLRCLTAASNLKISEPDDPDEREAVRVAEQVMRMPEASPGNDARPTPNADRIVDSLMPAEHRDLTIGAYSGRRSLQRACACGGDCPRCQRHSADLPISQPHDASEIAAENMADTITRKWDGDSSPLSVFRNEITSSHGSGGQMDSRTQRFMESRFGSDFRDVVIHTDEDAAQMNRELDARAFTVCNHIYFNEGQYQPNSESGKHLLAHELAHVRQGDGLIRRCVDPKRNDPLYDGIVKTIQATAAYKALAPDDKTVADGIITDAKKKPACLYYAGELKLLFDTPEKPPGVISKETKASTVQEAAKEQARVAKPAEAKNLTIEETASADPARTWVKIKGKFGGGTYQVDRSNPRNIVVKAKIFLKPAGTGTAEDVKNIRKMEDGIEKAASMKGFLVDIEFVDTPDPDTFTAEVDPSQWETATNWSGGDPTGFAHELLHMFAYELDRYNYIEAHAANESMRIPDRLYWFAQQLTKPAGFDKPLSIMGSGQHPLNDDACRVAGLDIASCVEAREKAARP